MITPSKTRLKSAFPQWAVALALAAAYAMTGCAYTFQKSRDSSALQKEGVRKIYIAPLRNDTYKVGVENLLYNELVQSISAGRRVQIVSRAENADAILRGTVVQAEYSASAATDSNALFGVAGQKVITMAVATEYQAVVTCDFRLERPGPEVTNDPLLLAARAKMEPAPPSGEKFDPKVQAIPQKIRDPKLLWTSGFSRVKRFPASNQRGSFGTTAPLINESEFDRSLREMAHEMMLEVNESMFAAF